MPADSASPVSLAPAFLGVERSITGRRWTERSPGAERLGLAIAQTHGLPEIVGRVLAGRGVPLDEAAAYLEPTLRDLLPDPLKLKDMDAAADRLARAVIAGERVAVFGDYDVDGAASSAQILRWMRMVGRNATLYIPDRIDEGYGPNVPAMTELGAAHDLLIAVDCGTVAFEPIAAARAAGADVIVADHHLAADTLPDCAAVVNPNRQDDESGQGHLCAAGVVFLLLIATQNRLKAAGYLSESRPPPNLLSLLDMVALATVADVAPLIGVNRALVRQGLKIMARRANAGLKALSDVGRLTSAPTAYHLGYVLGPRVNAGGRVGQADLGARLLATDDEGEAQAIAERLEGHNAERRAIEAAVLDAAIEQVDARAGGAEAALVWAAGAGWHPGVVGIAASRLKERYNRPSVVIGFENGEGKGSGRSVEGVDLGGAVSLAAAEGVLLRGGGHKMAAGLTVAEDRLDEAVERLTTLLERQGAADLGPPDLRIDGALAASGVTLELVETLEAAGPFGSGAPAPRFVIPAAEVAWAKRAGETHLRFTAKDSAGGKLEAIAFRAFDGPLGPFLESRNRAPTHLAGRIEIDDWGGRRRAKLRIEDAAEA